MYLSSAINRADGPEDRSPAERCLAATLPDFGSWVGGFSRIVQAPGELSIFYDIGAGQGRHREIPITTAPHLPPNVRQWWGDSRGHWEGDTLVVETTNIEPKMHGLWQEKSWYSGPNSRVIERYRRVDEHTIDARFTIEDSTQYTRPWTFAVPWRTDNAPDRILEYACHEGNYGLSNILAGARAREKAAAEEKAAAAKTKSGGR